MNQANLLHTSIFQSQTLTTIFSDNGLTMKSISSSLKETMNYSDLVHDTIHNFSSRYKDYEHTTVITTQSDDSHITPPVVVTSNHNGRRSNLHHGDLSRNNNYNKTERLNLLSSDEEIWQLVIVFVIMLIVLLIVKVITAIDCDIMCNCYNALWLLLAIYPKLTAQAKAK